jgi:hypothetical protein
MDKNEFTPGETRKIFSIKRPTFHVWVKDCGITPDIQAAGKLGEKNIYSFENVIELGLIQELLKRRWGAVGDRDHAATYEIIKKLRKILRFTRLLLDSKNFNDLERYLVLKLKFKKNSNETSNYEVGYSFYRKDGSTIIDALKSDMNEWKKWDDIRIIPLNNLIQGIYKKIKDSL